MGVLTRFLKGKDLFPVIFNIFSGLLCRLDRVVGLVARVGRLSIKILLMQI